MAADSLPGNTLLMTLGAARLPVGQPLLWLKALCSIVAFWAGCLAFSQTRRFRPTSKLTLFLAFFTQAVFIILSAALAESDVVADFNLKSLGPHEIHPAENPRVLSPIMLLAFQFGGQIVASRQLGFNEVPTNVLTSLYCDFFSDPQILAPLGKNVKRNRRFASAVVHVLGGVVGAWLQRTKGGMSAPLWVAAGLRVGMAVAWLFYPSKRKEVAKVKG
jgi:hypothetical protein